MYHQYFGLEEAPFSIAVNPRYLFMSARHRDALAHLLYGVGAGGGFILLTGEVGTGKTTINRCLLEQLPPDTDIAIILNPALNAMELLASACDEFGIEYDAASHTLKTLTDSLHSFLLDNHGRCRKTVLMIDEAQHLDFDVLEQIRLLTNLETHDQKLLQIILIGQPELAQMLARPELRQLNQRITARYNLEPLNREETGAYIRHRLQVAGMPAGQELFPQRVVRGVYARTRGIPRLINVLCDRILLGAYGRNDSKANMATLRSAAREVLGEEKAASSSWRWPVVAAVSLTLLVAAGGWFAWERTGTPAAVVVATPPEQEDVDETAPASAPLAAVKPEVSPWLLPPAEAMAGLWSLSSAEPPPAQPCPENRYAGLVCERADASTWDELRRMNRPLVLDMVTPERFAAAALILGIENRRVWVASPSGVVEVELAELGPLWTGNYQLLWHPPAGFERPLARGDRSEAVAAVAGLFAQLDGRQQTLAGEEFNAALEQRVRLFQRQHGLKDDGVVGLRTLLVLNEQLGVDLTAAVARQQLARELVQR